MQATDQEMSYDIKYIMIFYHLYWALVPLRPNLLNLADPREPQFLHLNCELEEIVQTSFHHISVMTFICMVGTSRKPHLSHCVLALWTLSPQT